MAADCRPRRSPPLGLGYLQSHEQPLGQIAFGVLVGVRHGRPHAVSVHQIRLNAVLGHRSGGRQRRWPARPCEPATFPAASTMATCRTAASASPASRAVSAAEAVLPMAINSRPSETVGWVNEGLSGHRADAGPGPRNDRANGKPVGLNGDAKLAAERVARDDGISSHRSPPVGCIGRG